MVTKRQLGLIFIAIGLLVIAGVFAANVVGARHAGFGPFQKIGLGAGVAIVLLALPLIKLGDKPA